jgi:Holliday junction resolvase RusA-like endonuclease
MRIRVNGTPRPQGSVQAFAAQSHGTYTGKIGLRSDSKGLPTWREAIRHESQECAALSAYSAEPCPMTEPVMIAVTFFIDRPKAHYGTGRNAGKVKASAPQWPVDGRAAYDIDKLCRAVLDGLTEGGILDSDRRCVSLSAVKLYAHDLQPAGAEITVHLMNWAPPEYRLGSGPVRLPA